METCKDDSNEFGDKEMFDLKFELEPEQEQVQKTKVSFTERDVFYILWGRAEIFYRNFCKELF